jgi:hypothetical protein
VTRKLSVSFEVFSAAQWWLVAPPLVVVVVVAFAAGELSLPLISDPHTPTT